MIERILIILFIFLAFIFADIAVLEEDDYATTSFNFDLSALFDLSTS